MVGPTNLWEDNEDIQHLRSNKAINKQMQLGRNKKIQVKIFPGNQSELMNNVYIVTTSDKKTIAHIGDQYNEEDME